MPTFLVLIGTLLTAITLPLILELFAVTVVFLFMPERRLRAVGPFPRLTVVVPAHNEEGFIQSCVKSLLDSAQGAARILVVAHNCSDATGERAVQAGAELLVYNDIGARGKGQALRHGFNRALEGGAEAVLVVDADSVVSPNLIHQVLQSLSQGAAAVQCRYEMLSADQSARSRLASLAFRGFSYIRSAGRDRLGLSAGISGNGFALSASLLNKVPYEAFSVVEDLEYHIHTVMADESVRFVESAVVSSSLPVSSSGEESQQSRWQGGRLWVARKYLPSLLGRIAKGKFRLIEPALDLAGLPMAFGVAVLLAASLIPLHWVHIYVLAAFCVIVAHVIAAAWAGPDFFATLRLLTTAPFYILWKLSLLPKLLKTSRKRAAWIRTDRGAPVASRVGPDSL
ncbi:MAG: glycosyltransferase family 2 protein [Acidobacteriota bacterium]|nr:glycosyltransferase family 2 protein [Acidobacteriota bacterium]